MEAAAKTSVDAQRVVRLAERVALIAKIALGVALFGFLFYAAVWWIATHSTPELQHRIFLEHLAAFPLLLISIFIFLLWYASKIGRNAQGVVYAWQEIRRLHPERVESIASLDGKNFWASVVPCWHFLRIMWNDRHEVRNLDKSLKCAMMFCLPVSIVFYLISLSLTIDGGLVWLIVMLFF